MTWIVAEQINSPYALYTTDERDGQRVYGPMTHDGAYNLGAWLQGNSPGVQFVVLSLQPIPAEYHQSDVKR